MRADMVLEACEIHFRSERTFLSWGLFLPFQRVPYYYKFGEFNLKLAYHRSRWLFPKACEKLCTCPIENVRVGAKNNPRGCAVPSSV